MASVLGRACAAVKLVNVGSPMAYFQMPDAISVQGILGMVVFRLRVFCLCLIVWTLSLQDFSYIALKFISAWLMRLHNFFRC